MKLLAPIFVLLLMLLSASAQINVTNYGAKGDYLLLTNVNCVSNSTTITFRGTAFTAADTNKLIEVWNAGLFQTVSNQTLLAVITAVNSATNITVSVAPSRTATNLLGCYATDSSVGFRAAIAAAAIPTDTLIIPTGNYLLIQTNIDDYWHAAIQLHRGGLTFQGQGTVTLTGMGGWRNTTVTTSQGAAPKGNRGSIFMPLSPVTNNYPLVWTNLVFDAGTLTGWNGGGNNGPDLTTGEGWDVSHHAVAWVNSDSPVTMIDTNSFLTCTFHGWRGEVLIGTTTYCKNSFYTVANSHFYDNNASCFNIPAAHDWNSNYFESGNFIEEFYRSYATNTGSWFRNNVITNMIGLGQVGMNGGFFGNPPYIISNNAAYYTNGSGASFMLTTPGSEVEIVSNLIVGGTSTLALGANGYQDEYGMWNRNINIHNNTFSNCYYVVSVQSAGVSNFVTDVQFISNSCTYGAIVGGNYVGTGISWSSNILFAFNFVSNYAGLFNPASALTGQYFIDRTNYGQVFNFATGAQNSTNKITYGYGSKIKQTGAYKILTLDNSQPPSIPVGSFITFTNDQAAWAQNLTGTYPIYPGTNVVGTPTIISNGQSATFYWNTNSFYWTNSSSFLPPPPTVYILLTK